MRETGGNIIVKMVNRPDKNGTLRAGSYRVKKMETELPSMTLHLLARQRPNGVCVCMSPFIGIATGYGVPHNL